MPYFILHTGQRHGYGRRNSSTSVDLHLDLSRLHHRQGSISSETESINSGQTSVTSVDENNHGQSSTQDGTMVAKRFGLAPLVSVPIRIVSYLMIAESY